jgi:sec-independent protein translocase protein TatA
MVHALSSSLAFGLPGGVEWIVILIVGLLLFGRRLPEIMRGLGGSVREFKKGLDTDEAPSANPPPANPPPTGAVSRDATKSTPADGAKPTDDTKPPSGT